MKICGKCRTKYPSYEYRCKKCSQRLLAPTATEDFNSLSFLSSFSSLSGLDWSSGGGSDFSFGGGDFGGGGSSGDW